MSSTGKHLLFSFGVISDVQYADIPDGHSFYGVPRYYRHSLQVLERAVHSWNRHGSLMFVVNLGDIVGGKCPKPQSLASVKRVIEAFEKFNGATHHLIGNHCLYNLPRNELLPLLNINNPAHQGYYYFSPVPQFRIVALDGYDISAIGWPRSDPRTLQAEDFLEKRNPNSDKNSKTGMDGMERRFVKYNGAVGPEQLAWLEGVLADATRLGQQVAVCCHVPLEPGAAHMGSLLWNYEEVMGVIHRFDCVKVCLAGHDHVGRHCVDSHGVHHRSLEAALECPWGSDAFGYIDVFNDQMMLFGSGRMQSTHMPFLSNSQ